MISYDEAVARLRRLASEHRLPHELVPISAASARVLRQLVSAAEPWPHFRTSNMDGFAVRASDTPGSLRLVGEVTAGQAPTVKVRSGEAVRITTGAAVPDGADAVVRVEDTEAGSQRVVARTRVVAGEHVRAIGSDAAMNDVLLEPGRVLSSDDVLVLANAGLVEVRVARRARIAIIATGNELVDAGTVAPGVGQVRNTTTPYLLAALAAHDIISVRHCGDARAAFDHHWREVQQLAPDVLLTTGAVSMGGEQDFLTSLVREPLFHGVAIRPGRPIACATLPMTSAPRRDANSPTPHCVWFGLPGNQQSSSVGVEFFLKPYLHEAAAAASAPILHAHLQVAVRKPSHLRCFMRGDVTHHEGIARATVHSVQASYRLQSLRESNAWIVLPEGSEEVAAGTLVEWRLR